MLKLESLPTMKSVKGSTTCEKLVHPHSYKDYGKGDLSLTLCMESKTFEIQFDVMDTVLLHPLRYWFSADRVSLFFAS